MNPIDQLQKTTKTTNWRFAKILFLLVDVLNIQVSEGTKCIGQTDKNQRIRFVSMILHVFPQASNEAWQVVWHQGDVEII